MKKTGMVLLSWLVLFCLSCYANEKSVIADRVPVQVKVTVSNANWVETIRICNTSSTTIPLTDIEFNFNYTPTMPTNIWGQPWVAWRVASQQGSQVVLVGGTPWTPALTPDPNCSHPLTIQFNAAPELPAPFGPFIFKSAGATPTSAGTLVVNAPVAPADNLANPQVNITGPNTNLTQVVNWGTNWTLPNLTAGNYIVNANSIDNGQRFFKTAAVNATITNQATTNINLNYTEVVSSPVTITLFNSPEIEEQISFTGKDFSFIKKVSNNSTILLPNDTYNISAMVSGYSVTINPNPLIIPANAALSINYQKINKGRFVAFFESASESSITDDATKTNLGNLPAYLNVVNLAFMKPDAMYVKGSMNYGGTGLQFNYPSNTVLKFAVANLHRLHPETKVLVSVGGPNYKNWDSLNAKAIADFVLDYGLDGVDINYMPSATGCATGSDGLIHCQIDAAFQSYVEALRNQLPQPYWITVTSFGNAAFGQDQWKSAQPQNQYTGMMLPLLRTATSTKIDMVNVMAYDLGATFLPDQALAAYAAYYTGPISMGVSVPPEAWGNHAYDLCQVMQLAEAVKVSATQHNTAPGMMLWSLHKKPSGAVTPSNPNAQMIATSICTSMGLINCTQPILLPSFR